MKLIIVSTAFWAVSAAFAQNLQCGDIAKTLKEYSISTSSSEYLNSVFDQYCEQNGESKSSSVGVGLEAVIKAIPVKFTGSYDSSSQGMKNFCKTYASSSSLQQRQFTYNEKITDKALDTLTKCFQLQSQGVTITHSIVNKEKTEFYLKAEVFKPLTFQGVNTSATVSCTGIVNGKASLLNEKTNFSVTKSQSFVCTRSPSVVPGASTKVYEESAIIVLTDLGNYPVLLPRDERLSESMASDLDKELGKLKTNISTVDMLFKTIKTDAPLTLYKCPVDRSSGSGAWASYGCNGQITTETQCINYAYRDQITPVSCAPLAQVPVLR